jgi:hypothetical protein
MAVEKSMEVSNSSGGHSLWVGYIFISNSKLHTTIGTVFHESGKKDFPCKCLGGTVLWYRLRLQLQGDQMSFCKYWPKSRLANFLL